MKRPAHLGLHHVALHVSNMAQARNFYVDLLGYQVEWAPDDDNLYLTCGNDNLALHHCDDPSFATAQPQRLDHLGIVVAEAAHVAAFEAFLRHHQVEVLAKTRKHRDGATSCYVSGPDAIVIQIIHHPPIVPHLQG